MVSVSPERDVAPDRIGMRPLQVKVKVEQTCLFDSA